MHWQLTLLKWKTREGGTEPNGLVILGEYRTEAGAEKALARYQTRHPEVDGYLLDLCVETIDTEDEDEDWKPWGSK